MKLAYNFTTRLCVVFFALAILGSSVSAQINQGGSGTITWAGGTLGAMANYGTSPGAVLVPGVNAFVTNLGAPITPIVGGSAVSSQVLKASPGNLYGAYANATVSGYLMVFNSTSAPSNGATTAGTASGNMTECIGPSTSPWVNFSPGPPEVYSVGITAVFSSTGCGTLTLSATAFFHGAVQ